MLAYPRIGEPVDPAVQRGSPSPEPMDHVACDRGGASARGVDLPDTTAETDRLDEDRVRSLDDEVRPSIPRGAGSRACQAAGEFPRVAPEHDHVAKGKEVR